MALATCRPCQRIRKDQTWVFPQLFGRPGAWSSPGLLSPRPLAGQGAVQRDPARWQPWPSNEPVSRCGSDPAGRTSRSALLRAVPGLPAALCTVGKGHVVYAVVKEGKNLRGTAWQCAGVICYFPVTKGHRQQAPTCTGWKGDRRYDTSTEAAALRSTVISKRTPNTRDSLLLCKDLSEQIGLMSSQWVQSHNGDIKPRESQPNSFIRNWCWRANFIMSMDQRALVKRAHLLLKYRSVSPHHKKTLNTWT